MVATSNELVSFSFSKLSTKNEHELLAWMDKERYYYVSNYVTILNEIKTGKAWIVRESDKPLALFIIFPGSPNEYNIDLATSPLLNADTGMLKELIEYCIGIVRTNKRQKKKLVWSVDWKEKAHVFVAGHLGFIVKCESERSCIMEKEV